MEPIKEGYTRVSTILGQWGLYDRIDPAVLEKARQRGCDIDKIIEMEIEGIYVAVEDDYKPYMASYKLWKEDMQPKIVQGKQRLYCEELMITGEFDMLTQFEGGAVITDIKCTSRPNPAMWMLQGAFYHYLCEVNKIEVESKFLFVQLLKTGKRARSYEYEITQELKLTCMAALTTYNHLAEMLTKKAELYNFDGEI